jgi:asparagine synthase (glutamine-hydrolysing)
LLHRLYPYLQHGPAANAAIARRFFGHDLSEWDRPGFGHQLRWKGAAALKRLFDPALLERLSGVDVVDDLLTALPRGFAQWPFLDQDQYLEIRTLLTGYLLASQGDRMLMAHSVEGRFPFLDQRVATLAAALPPSARVRVLDEKHVLKRAAAGLVPEEIRRRKKQPYRAPDAEALTRPEARGWVEQVADERQIRAAGVFTPAAARRLIDKCFAASSSAPFSNADNMALTGLLSTQVLYDAYIRRPPCLRPPIRRSVHIDRCGSTVASGT